MSGEHRTAMDDRGWFCLDCDWPRGDFTYRLSDARAHEAQQ